MLAAATSMTRRLTKEFIEKNGRNPTESEFLKIQCEVVNTLEKQSRVMTMTKEMYENFVKQGKKFVTLLTGQAFDSLEETGIDLDGDTVIVDGQKYFVNMESWYLRGK